MNYLFFSFIEITKWGFTLTLLLLVIAYFITKRWRPFIKQWLYAAALIVFVCCIADLVSRVYDYLERLKFAQETKDKYSTAGYNFWYSSNYELHFYPLFTLLVSSILLYIFNRKLNYFVWGGLVLIALHYEAIYIAFWKLYRDYVPSSWSIDPNGFPFNKYLFCFMVFNAFVTGPYFYKRVMDKRQVKTT